MPIPLRNILPRKVYKWPDTDAERLNILDLQAELAPHTCFQDVRGDKGRRGCEEKGTAGAAGGTGTVIMKESMAFPQKIIHGRPSMGWIANKL